jgi:hypothetical protein
VPATRSRTENWRQSLDDIARKGGALEITLARHADDGALHGGEGAQDHANLIWRVRVLGITDHDILVEQPSTLGHTVRLSPGADLVGLIAIGQNRWMFRTVNLGEGETVAAGGRTLRGYRLRMPASVERCQRRNFYRISTVGLVLPKVDVAPVIDPASAAVAETANRCHIADLLDQNAGLGPAAPSPQLTPDIGPASSAVLVNIGGGGVGLLFERGEAAPLDASTLYWLRIGLLPHIPAPLAVCARLKHTHIDSAQRVYAGMAFDFAHGPAHEKFVVDQLLRYVALVQRDQLKRGVAA